MANKKIVQAFTDYMKDLSVPRTMPGTPELAATLVLAQMVDELREELSHLTENVHIVQEVGDEGVQ